MAEEFVKCAGLRMIRTAPNTKIIEICFDNINDYLHFDDLCGSAEVQMRISLQKDLNAASANNVPDTSIVKFPSSFRNTTITDNQAKAEICLARNKGHMSMPTPHFDSAVLIREAFTANTSDKLRAVLEESSINCEDGGRISSSSDGGAVDQVAGIVRKKTRESPTISPIAVLSLIDNDSDNEEDDISTDHVEIHNGGASTKNRKITNNKPNNKHRNVGVICNRGKVCKETFDKVVKTFECYFCKKLDLRKNPHQKHMNSVHKGLKPFKCLICLKRFSDRSNLRKHVDSVHLKLRPFKCPHQFCFQSFIRRRHLDKHIISRHSGHMATGL